MRTRGLDEDVTVVLAEVGRRLARAALEERDVGPRAAQAERKISGTVTQLPSTEIDDQRGHSSSVHTTVTGFRAALEVTVNCTRTSRKPIRLPTAV